MGNAWVVRPFPHGINRMREFLTKQDGQSVGNGKIAIGWPGTGDLSSVTTRGEVRDILDQKRTYSANALGQKVGVIYRFLCEVKIGDYVLVPDGGYVYVGKVMSDYHYEASVDSEQEGYPHQRFIEWQCDKRAVQRQMLTGRLFDSLKGRQTLFATHYNDVHDLVTNKPHYFLQQADVEMKQEYLQKLQSGNLNGVNSNTFESSVCMLLSLYFPGLTRLATTNSQTGDTDLLAELPGGVNVRVQVKHFYIGNGALEEGVVKQLADSMDAGDNGIIVTSGHVGLSAKKLAEKYLVDRKNIGFIDGREFVDMLFQNLNELPEEALITFGLAKKVVLF